MIYVKVTGSDISVLFFMDCCEGREFFEIKPGHDSGFEMEGKLSCGFILELKKKILEIRKLFISDLYSRLFLCKFNSRIRNKYLLWLYVPSSFILFKNSP